MVGWRERVEGGSEGRGGEKRRGEERRGEERRGEERRGEERRGEERREEMEGGEGRAGKGRGEGRGEGRRGEEEKEEERRREREERTGRKDGESRFHAAHREPKPVSDQILGTLQKTLYSTFTSSIKFEIYQTQGCVQFKMNPTHLDTHPLACRWHQSHR